MALQKSLNRTICVMTAFLFLSLLLFLNPYPTLAGNSYSGCRYECKFVKVTFDKKNSNRSSYHIHAQCSWKVYGNAACPPEGPDTFIGTGWWDKYLGIAYEEIQFTGSYHVTTLAKCTSNPWLGSWVDCTEIQRDIVVDNYNPLPDYSPVSAKLMSYANKQELQQEEDSAISRIQAPHIQRPIDNSIFGRVNNVPIIIDHLKAYKLAYEFQHRDSSDKPFQPVDPGDLYPFQKPSPKGDGQYVITTVAFSPKTRGDFRVRARCGENLAGWGLPVELTEWSEWTAFSIEEPPGPTVLTPGNGRQFDLSEQVLIETEHDENFPITFSFTRKAFTSESMPAGTQPIDPVTTSCSSAAHNGVESISCYYTFDKTGEYTFSVKFSEIDTLAVTRTFKMVQEETKTIQAIPVLTFKPPEINQPPIDGLKVKLHSPVKVKVSFNPAQGLIEATVRCAPKLASWQEPEPWQTCNDYSRKIDYPSQDSIVFTFYFSWVGQHKIDVKYKDNSLSKATRSFEVLNEIEPSSILFLSPPPSRKYTFSDKIPITIKHACGNNANLYVRYFMKPETKPGDWPELFQSVSPAKTYANAFPPGANDPIYSDYKVHVSFNTVGIYKVEAGCSSMTAPAGIAPSREFQVTGPTPVSKILMPAPLQKFTKSPGSTAYPVTFTLKKKRFTNPNAVKLSLSNPSGQKVVFDFQYKEKGGFFRHVLKAPAVMLNHINGTSIATFKGVQSGEWRVRTRSVKSGSTWSQWQTFSVASPVNKMNGFKSQKNSKALHKKMNKPAAPPLINKPKNNQIIQKRYKVTFQIQHSKDSKLNFEFKYRKNPGKGSYSSQLVNMGSLKTSHIRTEGSIAFTKEGEYRFRVREAQRGARWSDWRVFIVKTGIKSNIKKQKSRKPAVYRTPARSVLK